MPYPSIVGVSSIVADTSGETSLVVTLPSHQADDILVVATVNDGGTDVTCSTSGWADISEGTYGGAYFNWFWKRAASGSETNPTVAATTSDVFAIAYVVRGCINTGTPYESAAVKSSSSSIIYATSTGFSTLGDGRLAVVFSGIDDNVDWNVGDEPPPTYWTLYSDLTTGLGTDARFTVITREIPTATTIGYFSVGWLDTSGIQYGSLVICFISQSPDRYCLVSDTTTATDSPTCHGTTSHISVSDTATVYDFDGVIALNTLPSVVINNRDGDTYYTNNPVIDFTGVSIEHDLNYEVLVYTVVMSHQGTSGSNLGYPYSQYIASESTNLGDTLVVSITTATPVYVTSVTYDGVQLTLAYAMAHTAGQWRYSRTFYLRNAPSGTYQLIVYFSAATGAATLISVSRYTQSLVSATTSPVYADATTIEIEVQSSGSSNMVYGTCVVPDNATLTVTDGTARYNTGRLTAVDKQADSDASTRLAFSQINSWEIMCCGFEMMPIYISALSSSGSGFGSLDDISDTGPFVNGTRIGYITELPLGTVYCKVRAQDSVTSNWGDWSEIKSFTISKMDYEISETETASVSDSVVPLLYYTERYAQTSDTISEPLDSPILEVPTSGTLELSVISVVDAIDVVSADTVPDLLDIADNASANDDITVRLEMHPSVSESVVGEDIVFDVLLVPDPQRVRIEDVSDMCSASDSAATGLFPIRVYSGSYLSANIVLRVFTTSTGAVYIFVSPYGAENIDVYKKGVNDLSFTLLMQLNVDDYFDVSWELDAFVDFDAAIDSSDVIHFIVSAEDMEWGVKIAGPVYQALDTSDDTLGTAESVGVHIVTGWSTQWIGGRITVDTNDKPHVIYYQQTIGGDGWNPVYPEVWYRNRISSSWSTAAELFSFTSSGSYNFEGILLEGVESASVYFATIESWITSFSGYDTYYIPVAERTSAGDFDLIKRMTDFAVDNTTRLSAPVIISSGSNMDVSVLLDTADDSRDANTTFTVYEGFGGSSYTAIQSIKDYNYPDYSTQTPAFGLAERNDKRIAAFMNTRLSTYSFSWNYNVSLAMKENWPQQLIKFFAFNTYHIDSNNYLNINKQFIEFESRYLNRSHLGNNVAYVLVQNWTTRSSGSYSYATDIWYGEIDIGDISSFVLVSDNTAVTDLGTVYISPDRDILKLDSISVSDIPEAVVTSAPLGDCYATDSSSASDTVIVFSCVQHAQADDGCSSQDIAIVALDLIINMSDSCTSSDYCSVGGITEEGKPKRNVSSWW